MKRVLMLTIFLGVGMLFHPQQLSAQTPVPPTSDSNFGGSSDTRQFRIGFSLGVDHGFFGPINSDNLILPSIDIGYRMGILAQIPLRDRLFLVPKAEINAQRASLDSYSNGQNINRFEVLPINIQLMTLVMWQPLAAYSKLYIIGGPNFKIPIQDESRYTPLFFGQSVDIAADLGLGMEFDFKRLTLAPEFRFSSGLRSHLSPTLSGGVRFHQAIFSLNFTH